MDDWFKYIGISHKSAGSNTSESDSEVRHWFARSLREDLLSLPVFKSSQTSPGKTAPHNVSTIPDLEVYRQKRAAIGRSPAISAAGATSMNTLLSSRIQGGLHHVL